MKITIKPATPRHWRFILRLRNQNRKHFRNTEKISWKKHKRYLECVQQDKFKQWIIYRGKSPIGFLKLNDTDLAIVLDWKYQSCGYGKLALDLGIKECKKMGMKYLTAIIRVNNIPSIKLYEKLNYKMEYIQLERKL